MVQRVCEGVNGRVAYLCQRHSDLVQGRVLFRRNRGGHAHLIGGPSRWKYVLLPSELCTAAGLAQVL